MSRLNVKGMSTAELVDQFASTALAQDQALLGDEISRFNRLYDQMDLIRNELKSRPGDQRRALLPLYEHPNLQVRLKAAVSTLAVSPEAARCALEEIVSSRRMPQAGDAGMLLSGLDDGSFVPK